MREMDFVDECYADKDLSLLKKLTLVIPTYNRNYYLSRCLWYHAHFPFGEIIVADSSPEEKKVVNRKTVQKVREMFGANVRYLEYEPETEKYGGDIYRKWGDAVQQVHTNYSVICTDKQFLLPTSVCRCIIHLEHDSNYVSSGGKEYLLYTQHSRTEKGYNYYMVPGDTTRTSESDDDNKVRFTHAFTHTSPMHNSLLTQITRTRVHKYLYKKLTQYNISDIKHGEIMLGYLGYLCGKYYCLDDIYVIRDNRGIQQDKRKKANVRSDESASSRYQDIFKCENEQLPFFTKFRYCLVDELVSLSKMKLNDATLFVDTVVKKRIEECNDSPKLRSMIATKFPFVLDIWYNMPTCIQTSINIGNSKIFNYTLPTERINNYSDYSKTVNIVIKIVDDSEPLQADDLVCLRV